MKTKLIVGLLITIVVCGAGVVGAYDASSPWSGTVRWLVPEDTTFSVLWAAGESTIDFDDSLTSKTQSGVQPDGQDNTTNTPILNVTNDGNVVLNITCNLNATKPAWAVLKVNNETSYAAATVFDTNATRAIVNATLAVGDTTDLYLWTDVTNADSGTTTRYLWINSTDAS